ncbi:MAG: TrbI/VirB10 family protein [Selenomonadaceae bacterium]|nr:TrbI/VirB10 family protein [Selenomonadaceae bacterium]
MEKLKTLILYAKKKFGQKNGESEEIGNYSMNEGQPDKVFGFRREVVKGVVVFFGTVLVLAFIFASSGDEEDKKDEETFPTATESEIADVRKPKALPNDYETLMAMNKAKEDELRRQAEENARKTENTQPPEQPAAKVVENPVPAIPERKVLPPVVQKPVLPEESPAVALVKVDNNPKTDEGKYKSAISFALAEVGNQDSIQPESKANPTQVKSEYFAANDSTLVAGTVIPVRLLTGINTDVEGQVMAEVLIDVYDTTTGTKLLIPQGSRLTGSYEKKSVSNGRVGVNFKQLVLPDGGSWTISENIVAIDGAGYAGVRGKIHHHTGEKISAGMIGASIAAMGSLAAGNVSSSNDTYTAGQIATHGAVANLIDSTSEIFKKASDIENTVTVEPGYEFNVYVTNNITF